MAIVTILAAVTGVFAGRTIFDSRQRSETELHALLHEELKLDAAQEAKIEVIEQRFAVRRKALELEMQAANAHLAAAIESEHGYGPQVTAAIDHTHHLMGELQKETLEHLFAMRAVLTPEQAARFDSTVVKALTPDKP
ncbi:Spy/CpxP family protein refolding chaperone [Altererythrobacter sp. Root672]|uniref:Spy/CpxP family protein refolding chaperone n=1 Tax=Altererythrobacter sp. Root672 TaxID=1736584 RepID=UPI001F1E1B7E|nr:periplasmic heavy metal sensor [Altererythrobacter sp. Root672]